MLGESLLGAEGGNGVQNGVHRGLIQGEGLVIAPDPLPFLRHVEGEEGGAVEILQRHILAAHFLGRSRDLGHGILGDGFLPGAGLPITDAQHHQNGGGQNGQNDAQNRDETAFSPTHSMPPAGQENFIYGIIIPY